MAAGEGQLRTVAALVSTLDDLVAEKARIEKEIYAQLCTLFTLRADLVFYDITSAYFEGEGLAGLARCAAGSERAKIRKTSIPVVSAPMHDA